ncbi:hypothetical protein V499_07871 [Pseudogymnoascus sp. VKM F-103]|uniref:Peroxin/Ferlin domain-containing protein n=1 Tax=Pseudogymnoascus verrucosus TaxID=342668 RepID=A0A1B8G705_9PEZI|nr:uncharacterized protein VE01_10367 [Pseudogymnoascus verrucosus]KFY71976.1 hypothetical protein V499_07871 [Pseudogymnoascus sp. VKM F-103]OBT91607.1 hypothetical protein VE01_10367 [Pseudogymnoascus verrucosus]
MTTLFNAVSHASSRRPIALRDEDYDHEIHLVDQTNLSPVGSRSVEIPRSDDESSVTPQTSQTPLSRRHSFDHGKGSARIRGGIEHKRWSKKWTEERTGERAGQLITDDDSSLDVTPTKSAGVRVIVSGSDGENSRSGRPKHKVVPSVTIDRSPSICTPESAIDVLYENERGGFLCGHPLFSFRALGMFDAAPWTNIAFKPSATNIKNAQVPDPGWTWAWADWVINRDPDNEILDDEGWEYSFMFSKRCSWHGPTWYNSFVRRRAWIRKRVRVHHETDTEDPHRLTAEYFAVHPDRLSSASASVSRRSSRRDMVRGEVEEIKDIEQVLAALKACRIDREKSEVVEAFVKGGKADLKDLAERMHDVMGMFIFQASRRTLLAHLTTALDETSKEQKEVEEKGEAANAEDGKRKERLNHLLNAVEAADGEVKRLEYWSDIKGVTEEGMAKGAVDEEQGWDPAWTGLDTSAPRDVIKEAQMPGVDNGPAKRAGETADSEPAATEKKGKGKENGETP